MSTKIGLVEVSFENLDYINIPIRYFKELTLDIQIKVNRSTFSVALFDYTMKGLKFIVKKEANESIGNFEGTSMECYAVERLFWNDCIIIKIFAV